MAEVYKAKPFDVPGFDRLFAVKRILPNLAEDDEFISMFIDEAKIAIGLNHPNISQIYELGRLAGSYHMVMEYIAGKDLLGIQNVFKRSGRFMDVGMAIHIAALVASALEHAHTHTDENGVPLSIVHRDVSPQNILISYAGQVKLIDFGIAKVAKRTYKTAVGVLKGKFSYMSPEAVAGRKIDHRADIFSLGTVLHEMLTRRRLFLGESDFITIERVREAEVKAPSTYVSAVPEELDEIVLRALAREPEDRFATAGDFAAALEKLSLGDRTYDTDRVCKWMIETFADDLETERQQRKLYADFNTRDDVQRFLQRDIERRRQAIGAPLIDVGEPGLEEREITQVEQAKPGEITVDTPGVGVGKTDEVVIAQNIFEPLPRLMARHRQNLMASIDLPDLQEQEPLLELYRPHRERRRTLLLVVPALLAVLTTALIVAWLMKPKESEEESTLGTLVLEVEPALGLEIFLDGRLVGNQSPLVHRDVEPRRHSLEIRHPEYQTLTTDFEVEQGRGHQLSLRLEPIPEGEADVTLLIDPPDAEVWVDRVLVPSLAYPVILSITGREQHQLEVRKQGYFVHTADLLLEPGQTETHHIQLVPANALLTVETDPPGRVFIDLLEVGTTESVLTIEGLDPTQPHSLRIEPVLSGTSPYETEVVFDAALELSIFVRLPRLDQIIGTETEAYGFLAVESADSWYRIEVDGLDTGLTTPLFSEHPLALRTGVREVSLARGWDSISMEVLVRADEVSRIFCSGGFDCDVLE